MEEFNKFYFEKYSFDRDSLIATFYYSFDKKEFFEEKIDFSNELFSVRADLDLAAIDNLLFNIHIVLGISYYKLFPTKDLVLQSGILKDDQVVFWKKMYLNGLGEFFIKNNISPKGLLNFNIFKGRSRYKNTKASINEKNNLSFLMWGGGKDSIVSSILLKEKNKNFTPYVFGKIDDIKQNTLDILGRDAFLVKRKISDNLFKLNKEGYYNGHVPITGIIAFTSLLSAYLYNFKNIVLSNEKSACESNTIWNGLKINHQYSKSQEFEKDFSSYVERFLSDDIKYFSLLKDKYEYEIASIFASSGGRFFSSFSSCNKNFKINKTEKLNTRWCQKCEKCCFVYIILSPFLDDIELEQIFGSNLYENKELLDTFKSIIGYKNHKPFECVGTYEESLLSIVKVIGKYKTKINSGEIKKLPYILEELDKLNIEKNNSLNISSLENKLLGNK